MQPARQLKYEQDPNKFDLRTHVWDNQGKLVGTKIRRDFIVGGSTYHEFPVNSGNLWQPNNQPAGRVECEFNEKGHIVKKDFHIGATHKSYSAPLIGADKVHYELQQEREKNEALRREIEAIKKEQTAKSAQGAEGEKGDGKADVGEPQAQPEVLKKTQFPKGSKG